MELVGARVKRGFLRYPFYCIKCLPQVGPRLAVRESQQRVLGRQGLRQSLGLGTSKRDPWSRGPLATPIVRDDLGVIRHLKIKGLYIENQWAVSTVAASRVRPMDGLPVPVANRIGCAECGMKLRDVPGDVIPS